MATIRLPPDFKEFLKLLKEYDVRYLLIGAYAVNYHGYIRATGDMDIWIGIHPDNAQKITAALHAFGMEDSALTPDVFLQEKKILRMGVPTLRLEITTSISIELTPAFIAYKNEGIVFSGYTPRAPRCPCISIFFCKAYKYKNKAVSL